MEQIVQNMRQLNLKSCKKKATPNRMSEEDHMEVALANAKSNDLSDFLKSFDRAMLRQRQSRMIPKKHSGFPSIKNGIIPRIEFSKLEPGVNCVHPGHQGSTNNVKMENEYCPPCIKPGTPMTSTHDMWRMHIPMSPIPLTSPSLLIILASRSSSGDSIPPDLFPKLKNTVQDEYGTIQEFLFNKTGKLHQIYIIQECGIHGSIMALIDDCNHRIGSGNGLHLPANNMKHLFHFHYSQNNFVGYLTNSPGEFSGKFSNHAKNLKDLARGGIPPERVIFMSYGIKIGKDIDKHMGVMQNFVIFDGQSFLHRMKEIYKSDSGEIPDCNEGTMDGYIYGMVREGGSRLYRDFILRKTQVGPGY